MGEGRSFYRFENVAPELSVLKAELENISGLPVMLTEEHFTSEHGKKIGSHIFLAFRDMPNERLQIEIGNQNMVINNYAGYEGTLHSYARAAIDRLGGRSMLPTTKKFDPVPLPTTPISLAELKRRRWVHAVAMIPLVIASLMCLWPFVGLLYILALGNRWQDRSS